MVRRSTPARLSAASSNAVTVASVGFVNFGMDRFLAGLIPRLLREIGPHGFVILTWDEGTTDAGCCGEAHGGRIATIVAGPEIRRHATRRSPVDHYGVLRTIEDGLGLPRLGGAASPRGGTLDTLLTHSALSP